MKTVVAGLAVLLACTAFVPLYSGDGWVPEVAGAIAAVVVAGLVTRWLGVPRVLQPVLGAVVLAGYLLVAFLGGTLESGLPTDETLTLLQQLLTHAHDDVARYAAPVPTTTGLVLVTAAGVGVVALLVDLLAVVLDRAALAGLPLLGLLAVPSAVLPGGMGGLPFALGAIGWMLLLRVEARERISRWGTRSSPDARRDEESSLGRVGRRIGTGALAVSVVVPLLVPGLDHRLVGSGPTDNGQSGGSSSAHTYNPITRLRDQLTLPSPALLLAYRTDDPNPDYLRMTTLDTYDGTGWSASPLSQPRDTARVQKGIGTPIGDGGPHQAYRTRVQVDGSHLAVYWLPSPYGPTRVDVLGTWLWDPVSQTVFSASRTTRNLPAYEVDGNRVLPDPPTLLAAGRVDPDIQARYGGPLAVSSYVASLTAHVTLHATTAYAKALALQDFFLSSANGFVYDLNPRVPPPGADALEAFLRHRHGFCEQYATAMAVMLRQAGIPSRVAVGFTRGAPVKGQPHTFAVTTSDAHAWPEAWFAGTGWVRFEPTPAAHDAFVPSYARAGAPSTTGPGVTTPKPTAVPAPSASSKAKSQLPDETDPGAAGRTGSSGGLPWWLVPIGLLVLLLALPGLLTVARRRARARRPDAMSAWEQVRDDAEDIGHPWPASDSPRASARRLAAARSLPPDATAALDRLALAAERERFAPPGRAASARHAAELATVRAALRRGCSPGVRLRAQVLAPSTIRWATAGVGDRFELAMERLEDSGERLRRRVDPVRWRRR